MKLVLITALGVGGATIFGSLIGFLFKKASPGAGASSAAIRALGNPNASPRCSGSCNAEEGPAANTQSLVTCHRQAQQRGKRGWTRSWRSWWPEELPQGPPSCRAGSKGT